MAENDSGAEAPTPTIGSPAATVSATAPGSSPTKSKSAASSLNNHHHRHHPSSANALVPVAAFCTASLAAAGYLL